MVFRKINIWDKNQSKGLEREENMVNLFYLDRDSVSVETNFSKTWQHLAFLTEIVCGQWYDNFPQLLVKVFGSPGVLPLVWCNIIKDLSTLHQEIISCGKWRIEKNIKDYSV